MYRRKTDCNRQGWHDWTAILGAGWLSCPDIIKPNRYE
jgi:hypothetical protein